MPQCGTDPLRSQHGLRAQTDTEAEYLTVHRLHQLKIDKRRPGQSRLELATIAHAVRLGPPCSRQEAAGMRGGDDTLVGAPQEDRGREEKMCSCTRRAVRRTVYGIRPYADGYYTAAFPVVTRTVLERYGGSYGTLTTVRHPPYGPRKML
ncbi:hypothetical protein B0H14DRAFT_2615521 [Mycena olivaceomarginata]|nr:hypothetical protein B0H14DRAFT_2615521 [Mycena olivaceomarginata]